MIAQFFDTLFKLAERYKNEEKMALTREEKKLAHERYENTNLIIDELDAIWQESESRKIELFEVMPFSKEDKLILRIDGLRIFKDDIDGHIFYEMERRHFDTEKEVIENVIREYNKKYNERYKRGSRSLAIAAGYTEMSPPTHSLKWTKQNDGGYERVPLPTKKEA